MAGPDSGLNAAPDFASLAATPFQSIDANGVDLLSGASHITSPSFSMGAGDDALTFALSWGGSSWAMPISTIWQNPDTSTSSYTVTFDGETAVFEPRGTRITAERPSDTFTNQEFVVIDASRFG